MRIHSIQVGKPETREQLHAVDGQKPQWRTAYFKQPVAGRIFAGRELLDGDGQADLRFHGGPDKAINAYCLKHYEFWRQTLSIKDPLPPASFGENLTLDDADEGGVCIGDVYDVGTARLQVSQPRQPCWKMQRRFNSLEIAFMMEENGKTGWYFRVLKEGFLQAGDELRLAERTFPQWTILAANDVMFLRPKDAAAALDLANVGPLSAAWKDNSPAAPSARDFAGY